MMGNLFFSMLFLLLSLISKGAYTYSVEHAPTSGAHYARCYEDISGQLLLVVYGDDDEMLAAYDRTGVSVRSSKSQIESCVSLTKRQFRRELRYRRLLAP